MIFIEQVSDKAGLKDFISLPSHLYAGDPNWIEPLHIERLEHLSAKNPASDHIRWQAWVARRGDTVVGRITAQVDSLHRELHGSDTGHFGMLDAIDDEEVFRALTHTAETWLKQQGTRIITGPFGLNINQESGLLVDGFDTPPSALMNHGKPYYAQRLEQQGYSKGMDLLAYWMRRDDLNFTPALASMMDRMRSRVRIRQLDRTRFAQEMQVLREVFNDAWQNNWGYVPFTEREFDEMGAQLKFLVPDDMIYIAEFDGQPCAFIVALPNINEAMADLGGRLLPLGWAKLLWRLKVSGVRTARVPLMGVRQELQFSRLGPIIALLLIEALKAPFQARDIVALEMSWILESNSGMQTILQRIGADPYKRYRLYEKSI
ncbi:N-acetyltransferase [Pseudomonas capeferrum]|uniref:N-acetyltransferase n=1 Tax=Pseudomonas capeferrum TaxID=1495066 RepID=UPI0015E48BD5|nr:N-acetyltransferase [Pseudomonas capeferrum]MBA1200200.1 N-acetyltransferase [Pseudomonas capeferrum]